MKHCVLLLVFSLILSSLALAGNDNMPTGARQAGMGNAAITLEDPWALNHNQASLANLKHIMAGVYYESRFGIKELGYKSALIVYPNEKLGVFSLGVNRFGYTNYNETKVGAAYARSFGNIISAGMQLNYISTVIGEEYGSKNLITGEFGIIARPFPALAIGAHIYNPVGIQLAEFNDERVPVIMRFGVGYTFSEKVIFAVESEKDIDADHSFKAGVEYRIIPELFLRTGISTAPMMNHFGIGLQLKMFKLDIATTVHQDLGLSPIVSLNYQFGQ